MKLRIFKSDHGDCLLLQSDGHNILCDGGLAKSMRNHVRKPLARLVNDNGGRIDAAYVSHIDQDHISGVLQLLEDAVEWKVHDFHEANGDRMRNPEAPRPPEIKALWHNSFRDQVGDNVDNIGDLLAAATPILQATGIDWLQREAHGLQNMAASIPEALLVSRYAQPELLDIPINVLPGETGPAGLLFRTDGQPAKSFHVGTMKITIVGPSEKALADLRDGWNTWLESDAGENGLNRVNDEIRDQLDRFANSDMAGSPFDLSNWNGIKGFEGVSPPNVASLVLMVEENGKRLFLTGDAHHDHLIEDLTASGYMDDGHLHLDALKIQHHGSEKNTDANFVRRVSADHYLFCGDGSHGNPEPEVLKLYYQSRMSDDPAIHALAPRAQGRKFTFWFSTHSSDLPSATKKRKNFEEVEKLVEEMERDAGGRLKIQYTKRNYRTLEL